MKNDTMTMSGDRVLGSFLARLPQARERVLMLDYDGTLAPFCLRPREAKPYPGVAAMLARLRDGGTRVILISGRSLSDLAWMVADLPHDEAWGCHGWQRRIGDRIIAGATPRLQARDELHAAALAAAPLTRRGARLECKPTGVAIHWRGLGASTVAALRADLVTAWDGGGSDCLEMVEFDGGLELRARGRDKGSAVRTVLGELGDEAACAYLGDDQTDEDAFAAIRDRGLGVLVRNIPRPTGARARVSAPSGMLAFLDAWSAA